MPDYRQSDVVGTKWIRACRVIIENPLNSAASLMIVEEEAINIGDKVITQPVANLSVTMAPENPLHLEIYNKLNELYVLLREERDQKGGTL